MKPCRERNTSEKAIAVVACTRKGERVAKDCRERHVALEGLLHVVRVSASAIMIAHDVERDRSRQQSTGGVGI